MDRRHVLKALAGLALCPLCAPQAFSAEGPHWSYEGADGPANWGSLSPAYLTCSAGSQQSPIDIGATVRAQLPPLEIAWGESADTIVNNGHTIQLTPAAGSKLTLGNTEYKFAQFHFHRPSEHAVGGRSFPMEVHFVHQNDAGGLAVIGALMATGQANPVFNKIVATMPAKEGPPVKADPAINPNGLLPANRTYYGYAGSLTTPGCAETVQWLVLTEPIQVAEADVAGFAKLYPLNARPVQQPNRRYVLRLG
jgi:carbonic anhydrase